MDEPEQRRHVRVKVDKPVKLRNESGEHDGQLVDISYSGAAVNAESLDLDDDNHVELESEDFGRLSGEVVRSFDDGVALAFDMDDDAKSQLVEEISGLRSGEDYD